ncbi:MAG: hypothetical protein ACTSO9_10585 [Candidatus Helarchaeota archaeon]
MKLKTKLNYVNRWFIQQKVNPFKYQNAQEFNDHNKTEISPSTFSAYKRIWKALKLKDEIKKGETSAVPKIETRKTPTAPIIAKTVVKIKSTKPTVAKIKTTKMKKDKPKIKLKPIVVEEELKIERNLYFVDKFLVKTKKRKKPVMEIVKIIEPNAKYRENLVSFYLKFYKPLTELYLKENIPKNLKLLKIIPNSMQKTAESKNGQSIQTWKIIPELAKNEFNFGYICSGVPEILEICPKLEKKLPKTIVRIGTINKSEYEIAHMCDGNKTASEIAHESGMTKAQILVTLKKLKKLGLIGDIIKGDFPFRIEIPGMKVSIISEDISDLDRINIFIPELHSTIQTFKNTKE